MQIRLLLSIMGIMLLGMIGNAAAQAPGPIVLSLERATARADSENPRLKAAAERVAAAGSQVRQAQLRPNPEIAWEGEEISGDRRGFGETEHTVTLSQVIELGGKRSSRIQSARSGVSVTEIDLESLRLDLHAEVALRFNDAALAQRRIGLVSESIALAEMLRQAAEEKVNAGAASPVEAIRAGIAVSQARLDSLAAHVVWTNALTALAAAWGADEPDFDSVTSELRPVSAPGSRAQLTALIETNPDIRRWSAIIELARHNQRAARALAVPDLTLLAGPKFLAADQSQTFVLGLSVPIPLFSRNQGEISASRAVIREAEWEYRAAVAAARSELSIALQKMSSAYTVIMAIDSEVIPAATSAFEEIRRGYRQGRFDYLDLLGSEQDLVGAQMRHLDALSEYHERQIEVERLTGTGQAGTGGNNGQ